MAVLFCAADHHDSCCAALQAAAVVDATGHPVISALIAQVEALLAQFGPSILSALPALLATALTAAGVPAFVQAWLIPMIVTIASKIAQNLPTPAPTA